MYTADAAIKVRWLVSAINLHPSFVTLVGLVALVWEVLRSGAVHKLDSLDVPICAHCVLGVDACMALACVLIALVTL